jgi:phage shock protein E
MNWTPWIVVVAIVLAFVVFKKLAVISPQKAVELLKSGALVIDVRSESEFGSGHLAGVINVPLGRVGAEIAGHAKSKSQPILLHCLSGGRSGVAQGILRKLVFERP